MKKTILTIFCMVIIGMHANAQEAVKDTSYWKKASQFAFNFNQGSFTSNWVGGGVNSVALGIILNKKAEYKKNKDTWTNDFQFQFGTLWNKVQDDWRKNADRLFFDSKYARALTPHWNLYANLNLLSQAAVGYRFTKDVNGINQPTKISNLFAPAFLTESFGLEYKPKAYFSIQISPFSLRQTIIGDKSLLNKSFPTDKDPVVLYPQSNVINNNAGAQLVADFNRDVVKDVNLNARYQAFASYHNFRSIDNRLDAQLTAKFAKYFNFNIGVIAMYFQNQSPDIQFAQTMGFGFLYAW